MHCDLPVRFDTYRGCGHGCAYCFSRAKNDLAVVRPAESVAALQRWLAGYRNAETSWCDWPLPLHFGGVSDPLQPAERSQRRTLACLEALADARYPFILSTKSTLAVESPWRDALARCNVVVQVSLVAPALDAQEPGAPPFAARLKMLPTLARLVPRVVVRIQPYSPDLLSAVLRYLPRYAAAGVHGVTVEGLKHRHAAPGLVKVGADWCYPVEQLAADFARIKTDCHALGLRFYCAENRLRALSDSRSCCGRDGLAGFTPNRANLNSAVVGAPLRFRRRMRRPGTAAAFKSLCQGAKSTPALRRLSYAEAMRLVARVPGYRAALGLPSRGRLTRGPRQLDSALGSPRGRRQPPSSNVLGGRSQRDAVCSPVTPGPRHPDSYMGTAAAVVRAARRRPIRPGVRRSAGGPAGTASTGRSGSPPRIPNIRAGAGPHFGHGGLVRRAATRVRMSDAVFCETGRPRGPELTLTCVLHTT